MGERRSMVSYTGRQLRWMPGTTVQCVLAQPLGGDCPTIAEAECPRSQAGGDTRAQEQARPPPEQVAVGTARAAQERAWEFFGMAAISLLQVVVTGLRDAVAYTSRWPSS
ncbi:hypothetical protein [Streptomyces globosus]|uniref:hypothetical protein n=1 Tax=Streptomyces globosus TaxID=68209 RepID=UPI00362E5A37